MLKHLDVCSLSVNRTIVSVYDNDTIQIHYLNMNGNYTKRMRKYTTQNNGGRTSILTYWCHSNMIMKGDVNVFNA